MISCTSVCSRRSGVRPQPCLASGYWHTTLTRYTKNDCDSPGLDYWKHRAAWKKVDGFRSRKRAGRTTWLRNRLA